MTRITGPCWLTHSRVPLEFCVYIYAGTSLKSVTEHTVRNNFQTLLMKEVDSQSMWPIDMTVLQIYGICMSSDYACVYLYWKYVWSVPNYCETRHDSLPQTAVILSYVTCILLYNSLHIIVGVGKGLIYLSHMCHMVNMSVKTSWNLCHEVWWCCMLVVFFKFILCL